MHRPERVSSVLPVALVACANREQVKRGLSRHALHLATYYTRLRRDRHHVCPKTGRSQCQRGLLPARLLLPLPWGSW
jgi:hypothetical protein